jgi:hypothetical protein
MSEKPTGGPAVPPGPANTTPANMADMLSRMDPAKLRDAERGFLRPSEPNVRAVKSSTKGKAK